MKRYGTKIKGGNSGFNVGYDAWNAYELCDKSKEFKILFNRRARNAAKKEIEKQVREYQSR